MIRRGDIYWIASRTPRGREQSGMRPALVIQNDSGNESSDNTIIALMTSRSFSRDYPFHVSVRPQDSGLREATTVLLEQLQTVDMARLGQLAGRLAADQMHEIDRALHHSLGMFGCPIALQR